MDFYEVINNRRTERDWSDKPVSEEAIDRIINAGLAAPSNNHMRQWEFIVLHTEEEKAIGLQYVKKWAEKQGENMNIGHATPAQKMYAYAMPRQFSMLNDAPYVMIPLFKAGAGLFHAASVSSLNSFASIWCVIENIFLAATAEGMACSMRIPVGTEGPDVCKALGVPEGYMMPVYIGTGYPAENAEELEQNTFTAEQKIHRGKW